MDTSLDVDVVRAVVVAAVDAELWPPALGRGLAEAGVDLLADAVQPTPRQPDDGLDLVGLDAHDAGRLAEVVGDHAVLPIINAGALIGGDPLP